jgi:hypothetical protein
MNDAFFSQPAEVLYFHHPDFTGIGMGKMLRDSFEKNEVEKRCF